jgi:uncharacterized SAM-binding protein YcdF (DUF218 family)
MVAKIIPAAVFLALFILFAGPVAVGIVNLGNAVGMVVSALLIFISLFPQKFSAFIGKLWSRPAGRAGVTLIALAAAACVILAVVISIFMIRASDDPPPDEDTTVVVLGCKVKDGRPSLMLQHRLDAAYGYLSGHDSVPVVVSGGKGSDEAISEALCMKNWLVDKGISPDRIYMEDKSVSTEENLRFSCKIINSEGLPGKVTLVTDGFHQLRAEMIAGKQGIETYNISGTTSWYLLPTYYVREWFGVVYYKLFG